MNNYHLNPAWMYLEHHAVGKVMLTKVDVQTPHMVLNELQSSIFNLLFSEDAKSQTEIIEEFMLSESDFTLQMDKLKDTLKEKGIFQKVANQ